MASPLRWRRVRSGPNRAGRAPAPAAITFSYGDKGKPELDAEAGAGRLHFNLTHSGDLALIALTTFAPVGVDIEHIDRRRDYVAVARRVLSEGEQASLRGIPGPQASEAAPSTKGARIRPASRQL